LDRDQSNLGPPAVTVLAAPQLLVQGDPLGLSRFGGHGDRRSSAVICIQNFDSPRPVTQLGKTGREGGGLLAEQGQDVFLQLRLGVGELD